MRPRLLFLVLFIAAGCRSEDPADLLAYASRWRHERPEEAAEAFARGMEILETRATDGDAQAQHQLGFWLTVPAAWRPDSSFASDSLRGVALLAAAGEGGEARAWSSLALLHTMRDDDEGAFVLLHRAAEAGVPGAQAAVAERLVTGRGTPPDLDEGIRWFRRALASEDAHARWTAARSLRALVHAERIPESAVRDELAVAAGVPMP